MKPLQKKCGTCKWLRPREDGKPFWRGGSYKCQWAIPADFKWPASVSKNAYDSPVVRMQRGPGTYMQPGDGKDCPCWEAIKDS